MSYSDDLRTTLGGLAAASSSLDAASLPRLSFSDLTTVRFFESFSGRVPDSFLDLLCAYVVHSTEFDFAIGGSLLADSIHLYRLRLSDPSNPVLGPSQGWDSIVPFFVSPRCVFGCITPCRFGCWRCASRGGFGYYQAWFGFFSSFFESSLFFIYFLFWFFPSSGFSCRPIGSLCRSPCLFCTFCVGFPSFVACSLPLLSSLAPAFPFSSPSVAYISSLLALPVFFCGSSCCSSPPCPLLGSSGCPLVVSCLLNSVVWPCCFVSFSSFLRFSSGCPSSASSCCLFFFFPCRLFFGSYCHLQVFAGDRHLFGSVSLFLAGSHLFAGPPRGFAGLLHSAYSFCFISSSLCSSFPFCSACSPFLFRLLWASSLLF